LSAGPRSTERFDAIVIGGGVIGCSVALYLRDRGDSVILLEREPDLLLRASFRNQARVHNGYHYPRSLLTGLRSRVNFPRFVEEFGDCVESDFDKYYAVARNFSKVTGEQFARFCRRIEAPLEPAPARVLALFNRHMVDAVFTVREYAFDADRLRTRLRERLDQAGVVVRTDAAARRIDLYPTSELRVEYERDGSMRAAVAPRVFNCTYSNLNELLRASSLPLIPLKHELTEIALVTMPEELRGIGVTVMCGPFFSFMPFPARRLHSFTHVRYTPHEWWSEDADSSGHDEVRDASQDPPSQFARMLRDARRYLPAVATAEHVESLFETKTVLPSSEIDDSRPILFRANHGLPGLTCILGGKIDNIYDVLAELEVSLSDRRIA
jgi:glycine/D-amino acid oxidase-like deaminating enzyme